MSNNQVFWLWVAGFPTAGVLVGLAGVRVRAVRLVLAGLGPLYVVAVFIYGLFRGGPNECITAAGPPGYVCHPTSFLSSIGSVGVLVVVVVTLLGLTPIVGALSQRRTPAVLATIALTVLIAVYILGLLPWVPAGAAVLAAAIAGPPQRPASRVRPEAPA